MVLRRLLGYLRPSVLSMAAGLLMTALSSLAVLGYARAAQLLVVSVQNQNLKMLFLALAGALALNVIKNVAQYGGSYTLTSVGQNVVANVRADLFERMQYLPLRVFDKWRSGEIMSRFGNDVGLMLTGVTAIPLFSSAAITLVGAVAYMFWLSWPLTLVTIAVAPLVSIAVFKFSQLLRRMTSTSLERVADVNAMLQESLESMRVIKAFAREPYEVKRFRERNDAYLGATMKLAQISLTQTPVIDFIVAVGLLILGGFAFYELAIRAISAPEIIAFLTLAIVASNPINQLTNYFGDLNKAYIGAARVFELLELPVEVRDAPGARPLRDVRGSVEFSDVRFSYDGQVEVLKGVTAGVQPGDVVALVGPSGAGKTTLVNLIPRFYVPTVGAVLLDGNDLQDVTLASLRHAIAIVPQDPQLFSDTIEQNIRYGRLDATDEEIEAAARLANAHDFITSFPAGYQTTVGSRGMRLSGGERQRIAIARAILRNPRVLILDEATSSLDAQSEALISEALDRLFVGRTTFVIAHRLSTIRRATIILVLADGTIVERGTHAELLDRGGLYAKLYETQILQTAASPA
jgi:ATP-binding cassette, subfamily B, bacterial MsbA